MKKKLFTLLTLLVAVFSGAWAQEVAADYDSSNWNETQANAVLGTHGDVIISGALGSYGNVSGHYYLPIANNLKNSDDPWNGYLGISSSRQIEKISILYCPNGTDNTNLAWVAWGKSVTPNQYTLAHGTTDGTKSSKSWDNKVWEDIDLSETTAYTVYISRSIREFREIGGSSNISNFGAGKTINVLGIKVWLKAAGPVDPTFTLSPSSIEVGGTATISGPDGLAYSATIKDGSATDVVSISDGTVTGLKAGSTIITVSSSATSSYNAYSNDFPITVTAAKTPITISWSKSSDSVEQGDEVSAPTFISDDLTVNATNFNFAVTGTAGLISVSETGVVTLNTGTVGSATVTATVINDDYSATPVSYTLTVTTPAPEATKWDFTSVAGTKDENALRADDGTLWTYDSNNNRYDNANTGDNLTLTAGGKALKSAEGLTFNFTKAGDFRYDIKNNRAWVSGATITIKDLSEGQTVIVRMASSKADNTRGFTLTNLSEDSWMTNSTAAANFYAVVSADGDVTLTGSGGAYLYTIRVVDPASVTVASTGFSTYVNADKALDFTGTGITPYVIKAKDSESVTLEAKMTVAKDEPVLLYKDGGTSAAVAVPAIASATADDDNLLVAGTDASVSYTEQNHYYVLATVDNVTGFYRANSNPVPVGKAYLDAGTVNTARFLALDLDGESTGIAEMQAVKSIENGKFYNLNGQQVAQPTKGMYIVNGKKVIIK